ncbi:MAG: S1 RNA-binding domain-containing protein [bacterium]
MNDRGKNSDEDFGTPLSAGMSMPFSLEVGDIVLGRVSKIDDEFVYVSTGFKTEGSIPRDEFLTGYQKEFNLKLDDEVEVMVTRIEDEEVFLSHKMVMEQRRWNELIKSNADQTPIYGLVEKNVKGGYRVNIGVAQPAFLPGSHLGLSSTADPAAIVGKELKFIILSLNPENGNIVLSHREFLKKEAKDKELELFSSLNIGDAVDGKVTRLTNFGAFVDIGGVEGLLHISEISWTRLNHPSELLTCGQMLRVKIVDVDIENKKVSLSLKQTEDDPWKSIHQFLRPSQAVEGTVSSVAKFGVFVRIMNRYEGLVHISELGDQKCDAENFPTGRKLKVKILNIDRNNRKLSLGLSADSQLPLEMEKYIDDGKSSTTIGDMINGALDDNNH